MSATGCSVYKSIFSIKSIHYIIFDHRWSQSYCFVRQSISPPRWFELHFSFLWKISMNNATSPIATQFTCMHMHWLHFMIVYQLAMVETILLTKINTLISLTNNIIEFGSHRPILHRNMYFSMKMLLHSHNFKLFRAEVPTISIEPLGCLLCIPNWITR